MSTASDLLALYLAAEAKILKGQSVQLGDRTMTLANLSEVVAERTRLERRVAAESSPAGNARFSVADFSR